MELPSEVPVMTLPSATLFPQALLPLYIFEPRYRRMLKDMLAGSRMFSMAMQKPGSTRESPCRVAGLGLIRVSVGHNDGTSHLILQGLTRVRLDETIQYKPYRVQRIRPLVTAETNNVVIDALLAKIFELVGQRLDIAPFPSPFPLKKVPPQQANQPVAFTKQEVIDYLEKLPAPDQVADLVTCALLPDSMERQTILETVDLEPRLKHLIHFLMAEVSRQRKSKQS